MAGAYRAVEFIKRNMKLEGATKASIEDSKKVVEICTQYAQKGMINIFLIIFFATLAFACLDPFFFIGYLISLALFGLFQALFLANAGGAWDNAKKIVEVELKERGLGAARGRGRRRHRRRSLQGHVVRRDEPDHQVHDAVRPARRRARAWSSIAGTPATTRRRSCFAIMFGALMLFFVYRSFYGMRITGQTAESDGKTAAQPAE